MHTGRSNTEIYDIEKKTKRKPNKYDEKVMKKTVKDSNIVDITCNYGTLVTKEKIQQLLSHKSNQNF